MATKYKSVEQYISSFPEDIRKKLYQIKKTINKAAPAAEEKIGYNMPLFKWHGMLVSFAAWKNHISIYPAPLAKGELLKKIAPFKDSKATLKFPMDKPLPLTTISKVVKLRMKENLAHVKSISKVK